MTKEEIKKKIIEQIYEIAPEHEGETIPEDEKYSALSGDRLFRFSESANGTE